MRFQARAFRPGRLPGQAVAPGEELMLFTVPTGRADEPQRLVRQLQETVAGYAGQGSISIWSSRDLDDGVLCGVATGAIPRVVRDLHALPAPLRCRVMVACDTVVLGGLDPAWVHAVLQAAEVEMWMRPLNPPGRLRLARGVWRFG